MKEQLIQLENGIKLLYSHKEGYFTYGKLHFNCGSEDETNETRGCAHLLEHMAFNGTKKYPRGRVEEIVEECGGDINACTSEYYTRYYGNVLKDDTIKLFQILFDMCFNPLLKKEDFNSEKDVVLQELHDRNDDIWSFAYDDYFHKCFGINPTVGTEDSIENMEYEDFINFHKKYYNLQNLVISVVTPLELNEIIDIIKDVSLEYVIFMGDMNNNNYKLQSLNPNVKEISKNLDQAKLFMGFLIPKEFMDMSNLYTQILGGGMTSRLFKNLRELKKLCYNIFSYSYSLGNNDYLGLGISFNKLDKYDEIVYDCKNEIQNMSDISDEEFNRAKKVCLSGLCKSDENRVSFTNALINRHENKLPLLTDDRIKQLKDISIDDFQQFVEKYCINNQLYEYLLYDNETVEIK